MCTRWVTYFYLCFLLYRKWNERKCCVIVNNEIKWIVFYRLQYYVIPQIVCGSSCCALQLMIRHGTCEIGCEWLFKPGIEVQRGFCFWQWKHVFWRKSKGAPQRTSPLNTSGSGTVISSLMRIGSVAVKFTEGHQYWRTDGLVGTGLMPYKAHWAGVKCESARW